MTNIPLKDEGLLKRARQCGRFQNDTEVVEAALREFIERHADHPFLSLIGTVDFDEEWDHREMRRRGVERFSRRCGA